jgi:precorrin-2 dehydrogenase/sirohydrochlorin ferrochelatase
MGYYPIFLDLRGMNILVVGGGTVAQRKIETLIANGGKIFIVSKSLTKKLKEMVDSEKINWIGHEFTERYLDDVFLVIAATDDKELNHRISESARKNHLLINAVDQPADCNFIVPAIVKRGDLVIATSTSGKSPAFAKKIRENLENQFGDECSRFLVIMGRVRKEILTLGLTQEENSSFFQKMVDSDILEAIKRQDWGQVGDKLGEILPNAISVDRILRNLNS